ncbi:unnamed protein product [Linum trigynum]|uniref:Uncharacterized protein n=1 Tax=Linum trigynum TaxID=586398 RepID=A0AAV2FAG8_9ROSI
MYQWREGERSENRRPAPPPSDFLRHELVIPLSLPSPSCHTVAEIPFSSTTMYTIPNISISLDLPPYHGDDEEDGDEGQRKDG